MTGAGSLSSSPQPVTETPSALFLSRLRRSPRWRCYAHCLAADAHDRLRTVRNLHRFPTKVVMQRLTDQIMDHAQRLPEGSPLAAKSLLHLGARAAVDQALSRLVGRGRLIRAGRGVYLPMVTSRSGERAPSVAQAMEALAAQRGETIVPSGAAAANALGVTTQVPVRPVYLTSGRSRMLTLCQSALNSFQATASKSFQLVRPVSAAFCAA